MFRLMFSNVWTTFLYVFLFGFCLTGYTQPQTGNFHLTAQDVQDLQQKIIFGELTYPVRHEMASSLALFLLQENRLTEANRLLFSFVRHTSLQFEQDSSETSSNNIPPALVEIALSVDEGKRLEARKKIDAYIKQTKTLSPVLTIAAWKADHLPAAYYSLWSGFKDQTLDPYSAYVMGLLFMQTQNTAGAAKYFQAVEGRLRSPRLERWLAIDGAKFNIKIKNLENALKVLQKLLDKNPADATALYWKSAVFYLQNQKEKARDILADLVPKLYPDSPLVTDTAILALNLEELNTAASVLERYEPQMEFTKEFYAAFSLVRKLQQQQEQADSYDRKARQMSTEVVSILPAWIKTTRLKAALEAVRQKRKEETLAITASVPLDKAFLFLLDQYVNEAQNILQELIQQQGKFPVAQFMLAVLQRRQGNIQSAFNTLEQLYQQTPSFRTYNTLSLLADFSVRLNQQDQAKKYYDIISNSYPGSYQADTAKLYSQQSSTQNVSYNRFIEVSPLMSKYENYAAAFVLHELMNHWDEPVTFARINSQIKTSPRRGLQFDEMLVVLLKGTSYRLVPFIGTVSVTAAFLQQDIPVVFCKGGMFASQQLEQLVLLTGFDESRRILYVEGVLPSTPHIFTEKEILEGICFAVYPLDRGVELTNEMKNSAAAGEEFLALHSVVSKVMRNVKFDSEQFEKRLTTIAKETSAGFISPQLALARFMAAQHPDQALSFFSDIESNCSTSAQYFFEKAGYVLQQRKHDEVLSLLEKALKRSPGNIMYRLARARELGTIGKIKESVQIGEKLRDEYPHHSLVSAHLLAFYRKNGDSEKEKLEKIRLENFLKVRSINIQLNPN